MLYIEYNNALKVADIGEKIMKIILTAVFSILVSAVSASAHGGGLDRNGCHHDNRNGGYHCH
jgi:hypothetical protein